MKSFVVYSVWRAGEFGYPSGSNKKIPQTKRMKVIRVDYFPVLEARNPGASASVVKLKHRQKWRVCF